MAYPCPLAERDSCHDTFETHAEASIHAITNHTGLDVNYRRTEDGQLMCPFASTSNCIATFGTSKAIKAHMSSAHRGENFPCPIGPDNGCCRTFTNWKALANHIRDKHRPQQQICPWADCTAAFSLPCHLEDHVKVVHQAEKYPCPLADKFGCDCTFTTRNSARKHANVEHMNTRYPCPLAKEYNYEFAFRSKVAAKRHALSVHKLLRISCPEPGCIKTFSYPSDLYVHRDSIHKKVRYPCPQADEFGCQKTFARKQDARVHAGTHFSSTFLCPVAEEFGCKSRFTTKSAARNHAKVHTHPYICARTACHKRFQSFQDAFCHENDPEHQVIELFVCPVQTCRSAMAGKRFAGYEIERHLKIHAGLDKIDLADLIPQPAKEVLHCSELPLYKLILEHEGLELTDESPLYNTFPDIHSEQGDADFNEADLVGSCDSYAKLETGFFPRSNGSESFNKTL